MQGKNRRRSGVYELYMSILSLFLTQQGRRAADLEQVLALCRRAQQYAGISSQDNGAL